LIFTAGQERAAAADSRKEEKSKTGDGAPESDLKVACKIGETNFGVRGGGPKAFTFLAIAIFSMSVTECGLARGFTQLGDISPCLFSHRLKLRALDKLVEEPS
jgi:hypothetical protein